MARRYDSFVIRCWALDGAEPRIEVEHIQSGSRVHVASLALAVAWLASSAGASGGAAGGKDRSEGKGNE